MTDPMSPIILKLQELAVNACARVLLAADSEVEMWTYRTEDGEHSVTVYAMWENPALEAVIEKAVEEHLGVPDEVFDDGQGG